MPSVDPPHKVVATLDFVEYPPFPPSQTQEERLAYITDVQRTRDMANGFLRLHEACIRNKHPAVANLALDAMERALELGWLVLADERNLDAPTASQLETAVEGLDGCLAALATPSSAGGD